MKEIDPSSVLPIWSNGAFWPGPGPGFGPGSTGPAFALERDRSPLPLATNRVALSGLTATADGYQPTGMNPFTTEIPSAYRLASSSRVAPEMSTTITSLLSALATNRALPSGETATASGVPPSGDWG